jgi:outer membrane protein assembly factor BamD (BamD/ComL family)
MKLVPAIALIAVLASGCALFGRDAARALADADARAANGEYPAALVAYDAYLARYPEDDSVPRVRAMRAMVTELIAVRTELALLRERVPARDTEVSRLRQELTARQAELTRLRQDLDALKRTDLQNERRRR